MIHGLVSTLLCSLAGSFASVVGKYALDSDYLSVLLAFVLRFTWAQTLFSTESSKLMLQVALIGLMLALNGVMVKFLVTSMSLLGTLHAITLITSFSFILAGINGGLFFAELMPSQWWAGVVVILLGVCFINLDAGIDVAAKGETEEGSEDHQEETTKRGRNDNNKNNKNSGGNRTGIRS